jgi:MarR family transcriptional regulator for hemolysin
MAVKNTPRFPLGLEIYETSRTMRRHFDCRARSLGFTQAQWRALLKLDENAGISQAGLADLLDMQPISLARILDRMVTVELVERRPDPDDRRAVKLFLTAEAGPILKVLREIADEIRTAATKGLSAEQQSQVIAFLRQMRANFDSFD